MIDAVCRELLRRGHYVMTAGQSGDVLTVSFDLMRGERRPAWLKAVQVPATAGPLAVELEVQAWQRKVLGDIGLGKPSPIVRRMIAEHGHQAVLNALKPVVSA